MININYKSKKLAIVTVMVALDTILSSIFRIEGMAPMSSVMNIIAGVILGPVYAVVMAFITGIIRMFIFGIPPLALTGAIFGAFSAGFLYRYGGNIYWSMFGEFLVTGIVGSVISVPVMILFTGQHHELYWLVYTPRFIGATVIGSIIAYFILVNLMKIRLFRQIQNIFAR